MVVVDVVELEVAYDVIVHDYLKKYNIMECRHYHQYLQLITSHQRYTKNSCAATEVQPTEIVKWLIVGNEEIVSDYAGVSELTVLDAELETA